MCTLATEQTSHWLMVDPWEAFQSYQRTAVVLDHFDYEVNTVLGGAQLPLSDERRPIRVMLLAGSDLISTMSEPGVWSEKDVSSIWRHPAGDLLTFVASWITYSEGSVRSSLNAPDRTWITQRSRSRVGATISSSCRSSFKTMCHPPKSVFSFGVDSQCDIFSRRPSSSISKNTNSTLMMRPALRRRIRIKTE